METSREVNLSPASPPSTSSAIGEVAGLAVAVTDGTVDHSQSCVDSIPTAASFFANCWATSIRSPSANSTRRPGAASIGLARLETDRPLSRMSCCRWRAVFSSHGR